MVNLYLNLHTKSLGSAFVAAVNHPGASYGKNRSAILTFETPTPFFCTWCCSSAFSENAHCARNVTSRSLPTLFSVFLEIPCVGYLEISFVKPRISRPASV